MNRTRVAERSTACAGFIADARGDETCSLCQMGVLPEVDLMFIGSPRALLGIPVGSTGILDKLVLTVPRVCKRPKVQANAKTAPTFQP